MDIKAEDMCLCDILSVAGLRQDFIIFANSKGLGNEVRFMVDVVIFTVWPHDGDDHDWRRKFTMANVVGVVVDVLVNTG